MTTVLEALKAAEQRLKEVPDPRLDAEWLFSEVLGVSRLEMLLDKRRELTEAEAAAFEALLARPPWAANPDASHPEKAWE